MPSLATLENFIALVESNAHVEAIEEFYAENATMQENNSPRRVGRANLMANEAKVMARAKRVQSKCVRPVFTNGDYVVIRWIFDFDWLDDTHTHIEELAYQRWDGEKIVEEKFFYDPAQLKPLPSN
jgi:hypothetical protein